MEEAKVREYLDSNGVPYILPIYGGKPVLRVMDLTQLPERLRKQFDERGFFLASKDDDASKGKKK